MKTLLLYLFAVTALGACALVPPHENLLPAQVEWRKQVGAML